MLNDEQNDMHVSEKADEKLSMSDELKKKIFHILFQILGIFNFINAYHSYFLGF